MDPALLRLVVKLKHATSIKQFTEGELRLLGADAICALRPSLVPTGDFHALPSDFRDTPRVKLLLPCPRHPLHGRLAVTDSPPSRSRCPVCVNQLVREHPEIAGKLSLVEKARGNFEYVLAL
jgi:hypothetical protein